LTGRERWREGSIWGRGREEGREGGRKYGCCKEKVRQDAKMKIKKKKDHY